jgi:hypothetical protein
MHPRKLANPGKDTFKGPANETSPELMKFRFMYLYDIHSMGIFKKRNRKYDPEAKPPDNMPNRFRLEAKSQSPDRKPPDPRPPDKVMNKK